MVGIRGYLFGEAAEHLGDLPQVSSVLAAARWQVLKTSTSAAEVRGRAGARPAESSPRMGGVTRPTRCLRRARRHHPAAVKRLTWTPEGAAALEDPAAIDAARQGLASSPTTIMSADLPIYYGADDTAGRFAGQFTRRLLQLGAARREEA